MTDKNNVQDFDEMISVLAEFGESMNDEFAEACAALAELDSVIGYASEEFRTAFEKEVADSYAAIQDNYEKVTENVVSTKVVQRWFYK